MGKGSGTGQAPANQTYGAYLALVYAGAIFGGYVADRVIGYQRSILLGAVIMAAGLFMISMPAENIFKLGLATIIAGNGLFKPNISTMVGKLYSVGDERRDSGFTLFYMGINLGAMIAPWLTGLLAERIMGGSPAMPAYKVVFLVSGIGMLISLVWFWFGRAQLKGVGVLPPGRAMAMLSHLLAAGGGGPGGGGSPVKTKRPRWRPFSGDATRAPVRATARAPGRSGSTTRPCR